MLNKLYIKLKYFIGKLTGNITCWNKELKYLRENELIGMGWAYFQRQGYTYQPETWKIFGKEYLYINLFGWKIYPDFQRDAIKTIDNKGGDCEDIHRLLQIANHNGGYASYLVSVSGKKVTGEGFGHAFCVAKWDYKYYLIDYCDRILCDTFEQCIGEIVSKYRLKKIKSIVIQDLEWKIVGEI